MSHIQKREKSGNRYEVCDLTGKLRFKSRKKANRRLQQIHRSSGDEYRRRMPTRTYKCAICNGWHLTSAKKR